MLIVNADDWGLRREVTDSILECWRAGAITSASAMVHMSDSGRAFELAAAAGIPLGLHINLTTAFTATDVPGSRRQRQRQAGEYFAGRGRRYVFDPLARGLLDACVADQCSAFAESRGFPASHADGHQHVQVCPTVLSTRALGQIVSLRRAHGFLGRQPSRAKAMYRGAVNLLVRSRFRSVPFLSLRDLHPAFGGANRLAELRALAEAGVVEVMVHPAWEDEREVLLSTEWLEWLGGLKTGSSAELS